MSMNLLTSLSVAQLRRAAGLREQIEKLEAQLNQITGGAPAKSKSRGGRRRFSAATRAKMAAAQKARWAKLKGDKK
jgi:uncharacterized small protein (DUF1192 family)